jgi:hypothetical protein
MQQIGNAAEDIKFGWMKQSIAKREQFQSSRDGICGKVLTAGLYREHMLPEDTPELCNTGMLVLVNNDKGNHYAVNYRSGDYVFAYTGCADVYRTVHEYSKLCACEFKVAYNAENWGKLFPFDKDKQDEFLKDFHLVGQVARCRRQESARLRIVTHDVIKTILHAIPNAQDDDMFHKPAANNFMSPDAAMITRLCDLWTSFSVADPPGAKKIRKVLSLETSVLEFAHLVIEIHDIKQHRKAGIVTRDMVVKAVLDITAKTLALLTERYDKNLEKIAKAALLHESFPKHLFLHDRESIPVSNLFSFFFSLLISSSGAGF